MGGFDSFSAAQSKTYASSGALDEDIDCLDDGPSGQMPAGRVRIGVGGTLVVQYMNGAEDTIEYASGDVDDLRIKRIDSTSTAQKITVYWFDRERGA